MDEEKKSNIIDELVFQFSRSSGAGGQHVNKTESRVELRFCIDTSQFLSENEKEKLRFKLRNKINNKGILTMVSQVSRSQLYNKKDVIAKFYKLLQQSLISEKRRVQTHPSKRSIEKRLEHKKRLSQKKQHRKKVDC